MQQEICEPSNAGYLRGRADAPPRSLIAHVRFMNMKKTLQMAGLVVALAVAFVAGLVWTGMRDFATSMGGPYVHSDSHARDLIRERLPALPDTAHHLYHAIKGFQDTDTFIACSVPDSDFAPFLAQVRELMDAYGQGPKSAQDPFERGPDSWPNDQKDPNWDLSQYPDIVVETTNRMTTLYSPSAHRIFVCLWGN